MKLPGRLLTGIGIFAVAACGIGMWIVLDKDGGKAPPPSVAEIPGKPPERPQAQPTQPQPPKPAPAAAPTTPFSQEKVDALVLTVERKRAEGNLDPEMIKLLARGNEERVRAVMALTATSGVRRLAVEALGQVRLRRLHKEVEERLLALADDDDTWVACSAVESLGKLRRDAVIPHLERIIRKNYRGGTSGDGRRVCEAAVQALGEMGSKPALDALCGELKRVNAPDWIHDYGSKVIAALQDHDKRRGIRWLRPKGPDEKPGLRGQYREQIRDALLQYARELEKRLPRIPNRASREYLKGKIREARDAARFREEAGVPEPPDTPDA
jgi:hypothetical protein